MEISTLLTLLLMIISLGGSYLFAGEICLIGGEQIDESLSIKCDIKNRSSHWAVKLVLEEAYLLNTVTISNIQKANQTTLIQLQNIKYKG